jgi:hypothetical protein
MGAFSVHFSSYRSPKTDFANLVALGEITFIYHKSTHVAHNIALYMPALYLACGIEMLYIIAICNYGIDSLP